MSAFVGIPPKNGKSHAQQIVEAVYGEAHDPGMPFDVREWEARQLAALEDNMKEQTEIPGTEVSARRKRQTVFDKAVVGDLVVATPPEPDNGILAIEQVLDGVSAADIKQRWLDQGVIPKDGIVEVWECKAGGYYRKRSSR